MNESINETTKRAVRRQTAATQCGIEGGTIHPSERFTIKQSFDSRDKSLRPSDFNNQQASKRAGELQRVGRFGRPCRRGAWDLRERADELADCQHATKSQFAFRQT